jgi:hypothetical protein
MGISPSGSNMSVTGDEKFEYNHVNQCLKSNLHLKALHSHSHPLFLSFIALSLFLDQITHRM